MGGELGFDMYQPEQITSAETAELSKSLQTWIKSHFKHESKTLRKITYKRHAILVKTDTSCSTVLMTSLKMNAILTVNNSKNAIVEKY